MALISLHIEQARQTAGAFDRSSNELDNLCGHLQQQWSALAATWEGHSKHETEAEVRAGLDRGRHCAEHTHERGVKVTQIADRFQAADENEPSVVQAMAWGAVAVGASGSVALPAINSSPSSADSQGNLFNDVFERVRNLLAGKGWKTDKEVFESKFQESFKLKWAKMSQEGKLAFLQEEHRRIAKKYGFEPVEVRTKDLPDPPGLDARGVRNSSGITIDVDNLNSDDPWELQRTLAHETRHEMQQYYVDHPDKRPASISQEQINTWKNGLDPKNYIEPQDDLEGYRNQPVEQDARNFGDKYVDEFYHSSDECTRVLRPTIQDRVTIPANIA